MLLNELQELYRRVEDQERQITALQEQNKLIGNLGHRLDPRGFQVVVKA